MVNFGRHIPNKNPEALTDPIALYETLDRAHDKGPLRPAQDAILREWFLKRREDRDTIIKLNTGQGKTLIGLLILQSWLNEKSYLLYICVQTHI